MRVGFGILIIKRGFDKIFSLQYKFMNFMGIGSRISLVLVIFAEFFCGILLTFGLFTRLACIPLIITVGVALFKAHNADFFGKGEVAALYLCGFLAILLAGAGRVSVDNMIGK